MSNDPVRPAAMNRRQALRLAMLAAPLGAAVALSGRASAGSMAERMREITLIPPASYAMGAGTMPRPTGAGIFALEDLGVGRNLQAALDKVVTLAAKPTLTLPSGVFEAPGFSRSSIGQWVSFKIPDNVSLLGSGIGTVLQTVPNSMTAADAARVPPKGSPVTSVNPLYTLGWGHGNGTLLGQFTVRGTPQNGNFFGGMRGSYTQNPVLRDMWFQAIPGYLNSPPGETYAFSLHRADGARVLRVDCDGRDSTKKRVGAVGMGITASNNTEYIDCTTHDMAFSHGAVWWHCNGIVTRNFSSRYNGTGRVDGGGGGTSGAGLNHETCTNTRHYSPILGNNSLTEIRYYSNSGADTGSHVLDGVSIRDSGPLDIVIERNQRTKPQLTNCPEARYENVNWQ